MVSNTTTEYYEIYNSPDWHRSTPKIHSHSCEALWKMHAIKVYATVFKQSCLHACKHINLLSCCQES